ncbi:hypothetical protein FB45DRAFT_1007318 [Roridomyces roridus]|uniref:Uncharacterized protein n=1 Tax=Roridomyces roridus TaxID=1738132 RepID=A0AAD7BDZ7_9AGAR|nr:hypothetical protein FB45DRAFT_1007318 [Roridomyces roridus]
MLHTLVHGYIIPLFDWTDCGPSHYFGLFGGFAGGATLGGPGFQASVAAWANEQSKNMAAVFARLAQPATPSPSLPPSPAPTPPATVTVTTTVTSLPTTTTTTTSTIFNLATMTVTAPAQPTPAPSTVVPPQSTASRSQFDNLSVIIILCALGIFLAICSYIWIRGRCKATAPGAVLAAVVEQPAVLDVPQAAAPVLAVLDDALALADLPPSPTPSLASIFDPMEHPVPSSPWLAGYPHLAIVAGPPSSPCPSEPSVPLSTLSKGKGKAREQTDVRRVVDRVSAFCSSSRTNLRDMSLTELGPPRAENDAVEDTGVLRRLAADFATEGVGAGPHAGPSSTRHATTSRMTMAEFGDEGVSATGDEKENKVKSRKDEGRARRGRRARRTVPKPPSPGVQLAMQNVKGRGPLDRELAQHGVPTGVWLVPQNFHSSLVSNTLSHLVQHTPYTDYCITIDIPIAYHLDRTSRIRVKPNKPNFHCSSPTAVRHVQTLESIVFAFPDGTFAEHPGSGQVKPEVSALHLVAAHGI